MSRKEVAYYGVFTALAAIASYIEAILPLSVGIPGIKLGLANIIIVAMLYLVSAKAAICISIIRILIVGFLFGNFSVIIYSLCGGILSFLVMWAAKRTSKLSVMGVSVLGGIFHNMGQIIAAGFTVGFTAISGYIPVLIISGTITGLIIGLISKQIIQRLNITGGYNDFLH